MIVCAPRLYVVQLYLWSKHCLCKTLSEMASETCNHVLLYLGVSTLIAYVKKKPCVDVCVSIVMCMSTCAVRVCVRSIVI